MYLYHADALALGGTITRPIQKEIPSQAACSLPATGGVVSCQIGKTDIEGIISFDSAQSRVTGSVDQQPDGDYNVTSASVIIENLNILNVIMADQVVVRVAGRHAPKSAKQAKAGLSTESELVTLGCHFDRLRIAGHEAQITTNHDVFTAMPTYQHFQDAWNGKKADKDKVREAMIGSRLPKPKDREPLDLLPSTIMTSFVTDVANINSEDIENWGPIIKVPHFGTIYLGEVLVSFGQRRVNMIRLELGSPDAGSFTFGTASGNGTPFP